jgi:hypothetical protein
MTPLRFALRHPDLTAIAVLVAGYPIVHVLIRVLS